MERNGVTDLFAPPCEEEVHDGEKHGKEESIDEIKRERKDIRGFGERVVVGFHGWFGGGNFDRLGCLGLSPTNIH